MIPMRCSENHMMIHIFKYSWDIKFILKVVILAGGKGTRILEYTKSIPKPMVWVQTNRGI